MYAQFFLGFHLVLHYLKFLWPFGRRSGLKTFRQNYVPEGAPAYFKDLRAIAHKPGHCTLCGLCDASCPLISESTSGFIGPMRLVLSGMRGGPLLFAVEPSLQVMASDTCLSCGKCESICPEKIPMRALSKGYLAQIDEIRSA